MPLAVGRYLVLDAFARGGMASVHLARLTGAGGFSRVVAVKRMHQGLAHHAELRERFLREALVVARLRHPSLVPVLDAVSADGELLLVMDYVLGVDLAELLKASAGPLEPATAVTIMVAALRGLHAAHTAIGADGAPLAIVHRDVKPSNILISTDGAAYIADFGIARLPGVMTAMTATDAVRGSVGYVAPEALRRAGVDARADVWGAATVLWEALTGRRLFRAEDTEGTLAAVLEQPIEPPSAHAAGVSRQLDDVVLRGLRRNVADRFPSARDMADALEAAVEPARPARVAALVESLCGEQVRARRARLHDAERAEPGDPVTVGADALSPTQDGTAATAISLVRRRPVSWAVAVLVIVGCGLVAAAIAATNSARERTAVAARPPPRATAVPLAPQAPDAGTVAGAGASGAAVGDAGSVAAAQELHHGVDASAGAREREAPSPSKRRPGPAPKGPAAKDDCAEPFYPDPADPRVLLPKPACMR